MKESPQEIGFVLGSFVGFALLAWEGARTTRSSGAGNYIFVLISGGIGWGIGWLVNRLF
jgi:drug/metabolite transporter (DMT)-like permease